jgi:hypothetical protein
MPVSDESQKENTENDLIERNPSINSQYLEKKAEEEKNEMLDYSKQYIYKFFTDFSSESDSESEDEGFKNRDEKMAKRFTRTFILSQKKLKENTDPLIDNDSEDQEEEKNVVSYHPLNIMDNHFNVELKDNVNCPSGVKKIKKKKSKMRVLITEQFDSIKYRLKRNYFSQEK